MKNFICSVVWLFIGSSTNAQIIPNACFENRANYGLYSDSKGWSHSNFMSPGNPACEPGWQGISGSSFLKLSVKDSLSVSIPAVAMLADNVSSVGPIPNFNCNTRPVTLPGKYKYLISPYYYSGFHIERSKWNSATQSGDINGISELYLSHGVMTNRSNFSIPMQYSSNDIPNSALAACNIGMMLFGSTIGDHLQIDDISVTAFCSGWFR